MMLWYQNLVQSLRFVRICDLYCGYCLSRVVGSLSHIRFIRFFTASVFACILPQYPNLLWAVNMSLFRMYCPDKCILGLEKRRTLPPRTEFGTSVVLLNCSTLCSTLRCG